MTQPATQIPTITYFEDILPRTGWGLYYKFMITMACLSSFTQAFSFIAFPFSIALSTCEHLITEEIILGLHLSFVLGRTFGGLVLNCVCDVYGRKRLLTHSMILIFLGNFMAAFAYNYYVIMASAVLLASGLEVNYCVVRVHLAEVLPINRRGCYLSFCDLFWSFGYVLVSVLGIVLKMPVLVESTAADMRLSYWRMILAIAGGLNITLACATALLEESPRYFMHIRKSYLAVLTLKQFYAINKSSYGEYLNVKETDLLNIIDGEIPSIYPEPSGCLSLTKKVINLSIRAIKELFSRKYLRTTIILFVIKFPLLILGHLEENILLAKHSYLTNLFIHNGIEVIHLDKLVNMTMCDSREDTKMLYYIYFILVAGIICGVLSVTCFVDNLGRKILTCTSLVLCAACYVFLFWIKNFIGKIIISTVLMTSFSAVITTVTIIIIESYPTSLRCTSWAVLSLPGLLISHFLIRYFHFLAEYFFVFHGTLFSGAAIAAYFLQDLKRKPMIE